jgi:hypothetical protein
MFASTPQNPGRVHTVPNDNSQNSLIPIQNYLTQGDYRTGNDVAIRRHLRRLLSWFDIGDMDRTNSKLHPTERRFTLTRFLPVIALVAFLAMIAVGEKRIRSSPKWPPPARHELGGWEIDNPPILDWAIGLNLPAFMPIMLMSAFSDEFTYALDDHHLVVYVPWLVFVYCFWYFVAYRLDRISRRPQRETALCRHFVLCVQSIITFEVMCAVGAIVSSSGGIAKARVAFVCSLAWLLVSILGWVDVSRT